MADTHSSLRVTDTEEITQKTGHYKPFAEFVEMLCAATRATEQRADLFLDMLTYTDLLALKSKRKGGAEAVAAGTKTTNNKRYIILTHG